MTIFPITSLKGRNKVRVVRTSQEIPKPQGANWMDLGMKGCYFSDFGIHRCFLGCFSSWDSGSHQGGTLKKIHSPGDSSRKS